MRRLTALAIRLAVMVVVAVVIVASSIGTAILCFALAVYGLRRLIRWARDERPDE